MTRQKLSPPKFADSTMENAIKLLKQHLDGIEVNAPDEWDQPTGQIRILVSAEDRPDWSRRQAGKEASRMLNLRDRKLRINLFAEAKGQKPSWEIAEFDSLTVCARCHELGIGQSSKVTAKTWERVSQETPQTEMRQGKYFLITTPQNCSSCPAACEDRSKHGRAKDCLSCRMPMIPIWNTTEDIPQEWL